MLKTQIFLGKITGFSSEKLFLTHFAKGDKIELQILDRAGEEERERERVFAYRVGFDAKI